MKSGTEEEEKEVEEHKESAGGDGDEEGGEREREKSGGKVIRRRLPGRGPDGRRRRPLWLVHLTLLLLLSFVRLLFVHLLPTGAEVEVTAGGSMRPPVAEAQTPPKKTVAPAHLSLTPSIFS